MARIGHRRLELLEVAERAHVAALASGALLAHLGTLDRAAALRCIQSLPDAALEAVCALSPELDGLSDAELTTLLEATNI
jgi:hypothetical protein